MNCLKPQSHQLLNEYAKEKDHSSNKRALQLQWYRMR